jgi:hypothetical protein
MTITFRTLLMAGLLASGALPAGAQSANRTLPGVPTNPPRVAVGASETAAVGRCRAHCQSQASPTRQSTAERQATQTRCAKRMS